MRIPKWLAAIMALGILAVGCSDDGGDTNAAPQDTFDFSGSADTPFCANYVAYLKALERFILDGGDDEKLYGEVRTAYATATASAPGEIRLTMDAANATVQSGSLETWREDIVNAGPNDLEAAGREVTYVTANCSIKSQAFGQSLQGS